MQIAIATKIAAETLPQESGVDNRQIEVSYILFYTTSESFKFNEEIRRDSWKLEPLNQYQDY